MRLGRPWHDPVRVSVGEGGRPSRQRLEVGQEGAHRSQVGSPMPEPQALRLL